jgi:hypothetical protein
MSLRSIILWDHCHRYGPLLTEMLCSTCLCLLLLPSQPSVAWKSKVMLMKTVEEERQCCLVGLGSKLCRCRQFLVLCWPLVVAYQLCLPFQGRYFWALRYVLNRLSTQQLVPFLHMLSQSGAYYKPNLLYWYMTVRVWLQTVESIVGSLCRHERYKILVLNFLMNH